MGLPSDKSLENAVSSFDNWFTALGSYPYIYNFKSVANHLQLRNRSIRLFTFYLFALLFWLYYPYVVVTLFINLETYLKENTFDLLLHVAAFSIFGTCLACHALHMFSKNDDMNLINSIMTFVDHFKKIYKCEDGFKKSARIRHLIVTVYGFYSTAELFLSPIFLYTFRHHAIYPTYSLLPNSWKAHISEMTLPWPFLPLFIFQAWFEATQWGGGYSVVYNTLVYLQTAESALKLIRASLETPHHLTNRTRLRKLEVALRTYSRLRILNRFFNHLMTDIWWLIVNALSCFTFISGFCAISLRGRDAITVILAIFLMLLALSILLASTMTFASVHSGSSKLHESIIKRRPLGRYGRALCRSFIVIGVEYNMYFMVQKKSLLSLFTGLSNAAISTVMSINEL